MKEIQDRISTFFNDLSFVEDTHTYFIKKDKVKLSVSKIVEKYKNKADWEAIKEGLSAKTGKSPQQIQEEWDKISEKACTLGTATHLFGEHYAINRNLIPSTPFEQAIVKFWNDLPEHIVLLKTEAQMYHKHFLFAGTSDILLYNTITKEIYIADYKTNKDLFKNFRLNRMSGVFSDLLCMNFNHYALQLSLYQILIEQVPGVKISKRKIIWLKPDGNYEMYDTEDYTEELQKELYLIFN